MAAKIVTTGGFKALTGCDRIRAMVNALTKHMAPVGGARRRDECLPADAEASGSR